MLLTLLHLKPDRLYLGPGGHLVGEGATGFWGDEGRNRTGVDRCLTARERAYVKPGWHVRRKSRGISWGLRLLPFDP